LPLFDAIRGDDTDVGRDVGRVRVIRIDVPIQAGMENAPDRAHWENARGIERDVRLETFVSTWQVNVAERQATLERRAKLTGRASVKSWHMQALAPHPEGGWAIVVLCVLMQAQAQ
jgi:hypothetical protein